MEVKDIPIPAVATIKVSKEDKSAVFETTVVSTVDNKYIFATPVMRSKKYVDFSGHDLKKEIKVQFAKGELYVWKNVLIKRFMEDGRVFLKITACSDGTRSEYWRDKKSDEESNKKKAIKVKKQG